MKKWFINNQKKILIDLLKSNKFEITNVYEEEKSLKIFKDFMKNVTDIKINDILVDFYDIDNNKYTFYFSNNIPLSINVALKMDNDNLNILLFD